MRATIPLEAAGPGTSRVGGIGMSSQPTVVVADDQMLVRSGFRMILELG